VESLRLLVDAFLPLKLRPAECEVLGTGKQTFRSWVTGGHGEWRHPLMHAWPLKSWLLEKPRHVLDADSERSVSGQASPAREEWHLAL
jgi:hypothetical protein